MMKNRICLLLIVILTCLLLPKKIHANTETNKNKATVGEFLNKQIEGIDNATSSLTAQDIVRLNHPPLSITCNRTDSSKLKVIRNVDGSLYLLSENELLSVEVDEEAKNPRLHFIGTLLKVDFAVLDVQIELWLDLMVIVVQQENSLSVYITSSASNGLNIEPVQTISTNSVADRFIMSNNGKNLFLFVYGIKNDGANELMYFKWKSSYFSKESQELIDLSNKNKLFVYRGNTSEPLVFAIGVSDNTTRIVSLKLNMETNKWSKLQSLYFKQGYIEHYVVKGQLYLIGCSTDAFCAIYKWKNGQFQRHLKVTNQVFEKIKSVYYQQDFVLVEDSQDNLSFFTSNNIVSFQPETLVVTRQNVTDFAIYKSRESNNNFFVEFLFNKTALAVNFYEISIEKKMEKPNEQLEAKQPNSLECVAMLKSQLKHRMPTVQSLQHKVQEFKVEKNQLNMETKKFLRTRSTNMKNSKVRRLTMANQIKLTARDLQKRAVDTNINVELTRRLLRKPSTVESMARAGADEIEEMENIVVEELIHNGNDPLFTDILLKSQPVLTLSDDVRLRNITANKIVVISNKINNIEITKLLNTTKSKRVPGSKKIKVLRVKDLTVTNTLNNMERSVFNSLNDKSPLDVSEGFKSEEDVTIKNLVVKALNGFDVEKLFSSMFVMGERNIITGSLTLRNVSNVDQLIANSLMDLPVERLLTTSTDQTVKSNLFINMFHVSNLTTGTVNDELLSQNVALVNGINDIEVPSQFLSIHVLKDLNIRDEASNVREQRALTATIENFKRHIIGTQATDLSQIYSGKVILRGSLTVKDVRLLSMKQTKIIVGDQEVSQNISLQYWMKTAKQRIQSEKFVIANQAVGVGLLFTKFLARHPLKEYILLDVSSQGLCNLRFEKSLVKLDVKGHKDNVPSMLFHLNQNAVFRQEPSVVVQGSIDFRGKVTVRNLASIFINDRSPSELVHIGHQLVRIEGTKTVNSFEVDQLLVKTGLTVGSFNNVELQKLQDEFIRVNQPIELDALKVSRFEAKILSIEFFEDHQFNEFIGSLEKQLQSNGSAGSSRNVRIIGDVSFASHLSINTLNEKTSFEELISMLVLKSDTSLGVGGKKTFTANLQTGNLDANLINGFSAKRLVYESLGRNEKQIISGEFFVKNLKTKSIRSKIFNKVPLDQFVDKTFAHLPLKVNLKVKELHARTLESRSSSFDVSKLIENVQFPKRKNWNSVSVETGFAEIPIHETSYLDQIVMFAVYKVGPVQTITGKVQTTSGKVLVKTMSKADGIINTNEDSVNVNYMFVDSVKKQMEPAVVIKGIKTFLAPLYVKNLRIGTNSYYDSKEINEEYVLELNRTIVRPQSVIEDEKIMKYLHAEEIELRGKINGIRPDTLVYVINNAVQLPRLSLQHLELLSLKTYTFFNYSLPYFLQNRMRMFDGPEQETNGFLIFDNLDLINNAIISSINQVSIDDSVFSRSDKPQELMGHKYVTGNITLIGPSIIKTINKVDFIDFVSNSVTRHKIHKADVMEIPSVELKKGLVVKQHINGYNTADLLTSDAHVPKLNDLISLVAQVENQIYDLETDERVKEAKPKRLIYVDYDPEVNIALESPREITSRCAEKTIEPVKYNSVVVRAKRGSEMRLNASSASLTVTPNFQCRDNNVFSKQLDIWWTFHQDSTNTFFQNFSFVDEISDLKLVESKNNSLLMILTMKGKVWSNIVVLTLLADVNDWHESQTISIGKNDVTKSVFMETSRNQFLVVSSFNVASATDSDFVTIFQLNTADDKFVEYQRLITGDKFNILLSVDVNLKKRKQTFLLMTREGSRRLLIHKHNEASKKFVFQRKILFESEIVEVVVLYSDSPYFIVSLQTGDFCMFEWGGVESWKVKSCGHFSNINQIKSYEYLKRQHLFLTSSDAGTALTVHRQG